MTERADHLLSELADRLSADPGESGLVAAESVRSLAPEILKTQKGGVDELVKTSVKFLELLFRSLRTDSQIPWLEYYAIAREASRRYAEKGIPLEALMEGLSVFRRSVIARSPRRWRAARIPKRSFASLRGVSATSSST